MRLRSSCRFSSGSSSWTATVGGAKVKKGISGEIGHPHEAAKPFHLNEWTGVFVVARWPVRVGP
jgi:hypothetical protein